MYRSLSVGAIGVKADMARAAALAAQNGFEGLHVDIREAHALGVAQTGEILDGAGVRASAFGVPFSYRAPQADFDAALGQLPELCATAQALGLSRTSTWVPSWHDELDYQANYSFHVERIRPIAQVLDRYGIRLGLEFLGPKTLRDGHKYSFIHTMDGMLEFCRSVGTGNLGLLFDAYHWYTAGGVQEDIARLRDDDIVDVHVNDAPGGLTIEQQMDQVRTLPGETGVIGIPRFLSALAGIGYTGPVMVEPFSARVKALPPEEAVRATAESLHTVWREAGLA